MTSTNDYIVSKKRQHQKNDPKFEIEQYVIQMTQGIDLLQIDGVGVSTIMIMMAETGFDLT